MGVRKREHKRERDVGRKREDVWYSVRVTGREGELGGREGGSKEGQREGRREGDR